MTKEQFDRIRKNVLEWKAHDIDWYPTPMNEDLLAMIAEVEKLSLELITAHSEAQLAYDNRTKYIERLEKRLKTALHCEHTVMQQENFNFSKELKAYIESEMAKLRGEK